MTTKEALLDLFSQLEKKAEKINIDLNDLCFNPKEGLTLEGQPYSGDHRFNSGVIQEFLRENPEIDKVVVEYLSYDEKEVCGGRLAFYYDKDNDFCVDAHRRFRRGEGYFWGQTTRDYPKTPKTYILGEKLGSTPGPSIWI